MNNEQDISFAIAAIAFVFAVGTTVWVIAGYDLDIWFAVIPVATLLGISAYVISRKILLKRSSGGK